MLTQRCLPFVRIDGRASLVQRQKAALALQEEPCTRVLLLSLTAGGTGLNLVAANHLVLLEPHFNPMMESQAADRIYRVGQQKPVKIYRLVCENSVEDHVRRVQVCS